MTRYFVALMPPDQVQTYAIEVIRSLGDRYGTGTAEAPPHITIAPPFDCVAAADGQVEAQLVEFAAGQAAVSVRLFGFGAFAPRVLYLNVERSPDLLALQARLAERLEDRLGIIDAHKQRPFAPHLTVASRQMTRSLFRQAWAELESRPVEFSFRARAIALLVQDGQRWQVQRSFPFQQAT